MIKRYNNGQRLRAVGNVLLGVLGYLAAYAFFYFAAGFIGGALIPSYQKSWALYAAIGGIVVVTVSGFAVWRRGGGHFGYEDSSVYHDLEPTSGGGFMMGFYAHRVTGPAYMLGQIFLAGPLRLLAAWKNTRNLIPLDRELEARLGSLLEEIRSIGKWHDARTYTDRGGEMAMLVKMDQVDFSPRKGRVKA